MPIKGWYYLHTNGNLIYKRDIDEDIVSDLRESPFVKMMWRFDTDDREGAWSMLVEALSIGADPDRIKSLAAKWKCNDQDAEIYAEVIGVGLSKDGDKFCCTRLDFIDLQSSKVGFGDTALEAMSDLCKQLGYVPQKMWGLKFKDLISKGSHGT